MTDRSETRRNEKALQKIYDRIPDCHCKGLCQGACGPVPFSAIERAKVEHLAEWEEWKGLGSVPKSDGLTCAFLKDNKCSIYENRPLICRLYGSVKETLQCDHGCRPTMTETQARNLIKDSEKVGK